MAKAGRPKKGSAGLPDWFDISKYADIKDGTALEWLWQLVYRRRMFEHYHFWTSRLRESPESYKHYQKQLKYFVFKPMHLLTATPIITAETLRHRPTRYVDDSAKRRIPMRSEALTETYGDPLHWGLGVRDILNGEAFLLYRGFPANIRRYLQNKKTRHLVNSMGIQTINDDASDAEWSAVTDFLHQPCNLEEGAVVGVDFSLPDDVLYSEFQAYVQEKRKSIGTVSSPFYGARDFKDWYKCGVLPFIDLKLWELTQGQSFHWPTFAEQLKQHTGLRYGSEDALAKAAKAAKACFKLVMDKRTLQILRTQAAREQASHAPKSRKLTLRNTEK